MAMTLSEIRRESAALFDQHRAVITSEGSPGAINSAIEAFAAELGAKSVRHIPVVADDDGLYGWCSDGVLAKVEKAGGRPVFGWCIWEWPGAFWTAEFHCVWESPKGDLFDITPKPQGETQIAFAPDYSLPPQFNFDNRPTNRRKRLREQLDTLAIAQEALGNLKPSKRDYEARRAAKAGMPLLDWMQQKVPLDPVVPLIDEVLAATGQEEVERDHLGKGGGAFTATPTYLAALRRKVLALKALKLALAAARD